MPEQPDVELEAQKLSAAAFELAKKVAAGKGDGVSEEDRGEANRLVALVREMQPTAEAPSASSALADAKLDLDWIRSGCCLPTSTRLHWFLQESGSP